METNPKMIHMLEIATHKKKEIIKLGLPWWHSGEESTCQCRGHKFNPWSGKIPHAMGQLSWRATTTESTH